MLFPVTWFLSHCFRLNPVDSRVARNAKRGDFCSWQTRVAHFVLCEFSAILKLEPSSSALGFNLDRSARAVPQESGQPQYFEQFRWLKFTA